MHSMYEVEIEVKEYQSNQPIPGLDVSVAYDYDSYGWFYFANTPKGVSGSTDEEGKVNFRLADYRYRILMRVADSTVDLNKEVIREGGVLNIPSRNPAYKVLLHPR